MLLFRALAKNMVPMTNADESPYAFSYLPVSLCSLYSLVKVRIVTTYHWQTDYRLLKQLVASLWITSFDNL